MEARDELLEEPLSTASTLRADGQQVECYVLFAMAIVPQCLSLEKKKLVQSLGLHPQWFVGTLPPDGSKALVPPMVSGRACHCVISKELEPPFNVAYGVGLPLTYTCP